MIRFGFYAMIAAAAFAVTIHQRRSKDKPVLATTASPARGQPTPGAATSDASGKRRVSAAGPIHVVVSNESLTAFQRAREQQPAEATSLRNAVFMATARARYERGANLEDCATIDQAPGPHRIRFRIHVSSTEDRFETEHWRFVEVIDGTMLGPEVIACMKEMLGGPYHGKRPEYTPFLAGFEGDIDLVYPLQSFGTSE